ncbi:MAG TPA: MerR family transcriptional regulator [Beutenbergiaceae bacterium]|nr:MerR family transcriptional regulator [Beutenbergiaceae bacterium]
MDDDGLLSIGEVARASGLSLSALRFYDRSGVLVPVEVAADTGYRWYARSQLDAARLVARLRRVGLPLAEISTVLAYEDPRTLDRILGDHLRRLEDGLQAAREEVERIRQRWMDRERGTVVIVVGGQDLSTALRAVRYAVGSDPLWPALEGVLIETAGRALRVTATDRYRAAFHQVPACGAVEPVREVVPVEFVDRLMDRVGKAEQVELTFGGGQVRACWAATVEASPVVEAEFPDLSGVVPPAVSRAVVDGEQLLADLQAAPEAQTWALGVRADGALTLSAESNKTGEHDVVLNAQFLTEAVQTATPGQLQLDLAGPIGPLAIRNAEAIDSFAIIMPIRPEESLG